jgi:hypothetical protein
MLSKIGKLNRTGKTKVLETVPGAKRYFIMDDATCEVSLSEATKKGVKNCEKMYLTQTKQEGVTNCISFLERFDKYRFVPAVLDIQLHLAGGVQKMVNEKLVHYDIGNESIFMDESQGNVLLGMFHKSATADKFLQEELFMDSSTALETQWLQMIVGTNVNWEADPIPLDRLIALTQNYFKRGDPKQMSKWIKYARSFEGKHGKQVVSVLSQYWQTWDMHSVNVWCITLLDQYQLNEYKEYMYEQVYALPIDRDTIEDQMYNIEVCFPHADMFVEEDMKSSSMPSVEEF